jgi:hypothetical protein
MIATPAVAWGTNTDTRPSPLGRQNCATSPVRSATAGRPPVRTVTTVLSIALILAPEVVVYTTTSGARMRRR